MFTAGNPYDQYVPPVNLLNRGAREIKWLNKIIISLHFPLYPVKLFRFQSFDRPFGHTVFFLNTDEDITASEIVEVVGESTDAAVYPFRIPSALELNTAGFHPAFFEELLYVDW